MKKYTIKKKIIKTPKGKTEKTSKKKPAIKDAQRPMYLSNFLRKGATAFSAEEKKLKSRTKIKTKLGVTPFIEKCAKKLP